MQTPGNMTTPPLKLVEGETIIATEQALRKKGILGNRFGDLHVTNKRIAFVKAIMKAGVISAAAKKMGAKAMVTIPFETIEKIEREKKKKMEALLVYFGESKPERFVIEPTAIDAIVETISAQRNQTNAPST